LKALGLSTNEISEKLFICSKTVKKGILASY